MIDCCLPILSQTVGAIERESQAGDGGSSQRLARHSFSGTWKVVISSEASIITS